MKKKKIFYMAYLFIIIAMSVFITSIYPDGSTFLVNREKDIQNLVCDSALDIITKSYPFLNFSQDRIDTILNSNEVANDRNFYLTISSTANGGYYSNQIDTSLMANPASAYKLYLKLVLDDTGSVDYDQSYTTIGAEWMLSQIDTDLDYVRSEDPRPSNVVYYFAIPTHLVEDGGVIDSFLNEVHWDDYNSFTASVLIVGSLLVMALIICVPLPILNDAFPFNKVRRIKGEINYLCIFSIALVFGPITIMGICGGTACGELQQFLTQAGLPHSDGFLLLVNIMAWALLFVIISLAAYDLKYLLMKGILPFIREDTYIGAGISKIKRTINRMSEFDLSEKNEKKLMKIVLAQMLLMIVFNLCFVVGILLSIIYSIWLFFKLNDFMQKIKKEYLVVLQATQEMSEGNYNAVEKMNFGIFSRLKPSLSKIGEGFEEAVKEETKSQKMKTELISHVSHDLKTPLTGITNYMELLEDQELSEEKRKEYMTTLKRYISRLTILIEDLFEVSKVNSGDVSLEITELDILALLSQVKAECQEMMEEKNLNVIVRTKNDHIPLYLDGNKTYRIFENLMTNISKYALENTRVYIEVTESAEEVEIVFKNISKEPLNFDSEEIMERFVRGDKSRHTSGSGLGLAIVKSFTEIQKGKFDILLDGDLFKARLVFKKNMLLNAENQKSGE